MTDGGFQLQHAYALHHRERHDGHESRGKRG